jgi:hypothetical protein
MVGRQACVAGAGLLREGKVGGQRGRLEAGRGPPLPAPEEGRQVIRAVFKLPLTVTPMATKEEAVPAPGLRLDPARTAPAHAHRGSRMS